MTMASVFNRLRELVIQADPRVALTLGDRADLVPLEGTTDGMYCLRQDGRVLHVNATGDFETVAPRIALALVGRFARSYPLGLLFMPSTDSPEVCGTCHGTGNLQDLPTPLASAIACECGGIGWRERREEGSEVGP